MAEPYTPDQLSELRERYSSPTSPETVPRFLATIDALTADRDEWAERAIENARLMTLDYAEGYRSEKARAEAAEAEVRALTVRLDAVVGIAEDAVAYIDTFKHTRPDRGRVASEFGERLRAATADPTPKCFCPGGGEPEGLNHRPGCPLASETKT
jgi:hypothetical protein